MAQTRALIDGMFPGGLRPLADIVHAYFVPMKMRPKHEAFAGNYELCMSIDRNGIERGMIGAAAGNHLEIFRLLLQINMDEGWQGEFKAVEAAYRNGRPEFIELLPSDHRTGERLLYAIQGAYRGGHAHLIAELPLLDDNAIGWAMKGACRGGHMARVEELMEHGAIFNDMCMRLACKAGSFELVKLMRGHDPDYGLVGACKKGHTDIAKMMLAHGATADDGLPYACDGAHLHVIELLLEHGADPNKCLESACNFGFEAAAHLAIQHGAINFQSGFEAACDGGRLHMMRMMIGRLRPDADLLHGLERAARHGHLDVVREVADRIAARQAAHLTERMARYGKKGGASGPKLKNGAHATLEHVSSHVHDRAQHRRLLHPVHA